MLKVDYKNVDWQYLLVCATGLTLGLTGWKIGFQIAIAMAVVQFIHTLINNRSLSAFPVQVRITYTLLLTSAWPESMNWLYWLPAIGTWAYIFFSYCLLARTLSLLPFISKKTISINRVRSILLTPPVNNILNPA
jgi:hypothetical protein